MEKFKRSLAFCGIVAVFCLGSCLTTSDELDLNRDISLDMQIAPGGFSIPIGSLDTLFLDSLIKTDDDSVLITLDNGVFAFNMDGSIDKVKVSIDEVVIDIPEPEIETITTHFDTPTKDDLFLTVPASSNNTVLNISGIDLSTINNYLPSFSMPVKTASVPILVKNISFNKELEIPAQESEIEFEYNLPSDVDALKKVYFGQEASTNGQLLKLNVDLGGIYAVLNNPTIRIKNLTIGFPSNFTIVKDNEISDFIAESGAVNVSGSTLTIAMSEGQYVKDLSDSPSKILPISFYLKEADFSSYNVNQAVSYSGDINYALTLEIGGTTKGTGELYVEVDLNDKLIMKDFTVDTKEKVVTLDPDFVSSSCEVKGLDDMKRINTIEFDQNLSSIDFKISDLDISPFEFGAGSAITLVFSNDFEFNKTIDYEGKASWTTQGSNMNVLVVDPASASGQTIKLVLKSLTLNQDVDKMKASITVDNKVYYSAEVKIAAKQDLNASDLASLDDKPVSFEVSGQIVVIDASFITRQIKTDFNEVTKISIDEEVDKTLKSLSRIDVEPADVSMNIRFENVPDDIVNEGLTLSNFNITFPKFLKVSYEGDDENTHMSDDGHSLVINKTLTQTELSSGGSGYTISGIKVNGMEFTDPLDVVNGRLVLTDEEVRLTGKATIGEANLGLQGLNDITIIPTVEFGKIVVKSVYGKVNPTIDPVNEEVELSLGDNDFFKNDNNRLSLSDPELTINLNSNITLPIDIRLSLTSLNSDGETIEENIVPDDTVIRIPMCSPQAESRKTTLVIYQNGNRAGTSDDTVYVRMSKLSELMKTIPDKIKFDLTANVDSTTNYLVDLTRDFSVSGDYKVLIPIAFNDLYVEYSDTVNELSESLEDVGDKVEAAKMKIAAEVKSTVPLGVTIKAKALDVMGRELSGVVIDSCVVAAGNESAPDNTMDLNVKVEKGYLERIESIVFTAACKSTAGASIRKDQWIWIHKMRLVLPDGVKVDLTDKKDK